jgi:hypothetical protein
MTTIVGTVAGACTYVATSDLKTYLGISTTTDDSLLALCLARAQAAIEAYTHRRFDAHTETHYFRQESVLIPQAYWGRDAMVEVLNPTQTVLYLDDDLLSVTTLTNGDGTSITAASYWLEPRNTAPYWYIRLKSTVSWTFSTDGEISVLGSWGYSSTAPYDIQHACLRLGAYYYRQKDAQVYDTTATPELGVITVPQGMPRDVRMILDQYVRLV